MPVYIALLRGINIGPHKRMKMDKLRAACQSAGLSDVATYIQSGNIVFRATKLTPDALAKRLGECMVRDFGFAADVITRTREEMQSVVEQNPLLKIRGVDPARLHVVFLSEKPPTAALKKLQALILSPDQVRDAGKEIYFYFPNGVSGSSLWKHPLDKVLSVTGTMRNWNTVNQLCQMARNLE